MDFGNMVPICFITALKGFLTQKPSNEQPRNQETKKPRNQNTRNQETKKPDTFFIFEEGNPQHPLTYRLPPLHPTEVVP